MILVAAFLAVGDVAASEVAQASATPSTPAVAVPLADHVPAATSTTAGTTPPDTDGATTSTTSRSAHAPSAPSTTSTTGAHTLSSTSHATGPVTPSSPPTTTPTPTPVTTGPTAPTGPVSHAVVAGELQFIESAQLPDGAIPIYPGSSTVWPYISDYAAMGLARGAALLGDSRAADDAWRFLDWYQANEGPGGIVTNATVTGDTTVATGKVDSTDATAGLFLVAAWETWSATHDRARLDALAPAISTAVAVVHSTQDSDGLTWALADYHAKYLMDEAEAYEGLRAGDLLAGVLGDTSLVSTATSDADRMATGVAGLWDPATGAYDWAESGNGGRHATDWANLYPDGFEQVWAVAFGLVPESRATALLSHFTSVQPQWSDPSATAMNLQNANEVRSTVEYWPVGVWALAVTGEHGAASQAQAAIEAGASESTNGWPYTPAIAGQLIVGDSLMAGMSIL